MKKLQNTLTKFSAGHCPSFTSFHPPFGADTAERLSVLPPEEVVSHLETLPLSSRVQTFSYLPLPLQAAVISAMNLRKARTLFAVLPGDERADLCKRLQPDTLKRLLGALDSRERDSLLRLATYPEETAGAVTTTDFAVLSPDETVARALKSLRQQAPSKETIYTAYVLDEKLHLLGTVSLRELILAPPQQPVVTLMHPHPLTVDATAPREQAAELISRHDLLALPVLNEKKEMIGIVTVDDAMDVVAEEETSSLARFGGSRLDASELDFRESSLKRMFMARFFWLALLSLFGVLVSSLVASQAELLSRVIILAAFMTPIIDMGGNTGSQSATLVLRAMALGQIRLSWRDVFFVLKRDLPVAIALGIAVSLMEVLLSFLTKEVSISILLTVGLSMAAVTICGSLVGLLLPFAARRIGADPATLSAPLTTSIMDFAGVFIYFAIAHACMSEAFM